MTSHPPFSGSDAFRTTQWSQVAGAADQRSECLDWLIRRYWKPVYAYLLRHQGVDQTEAEDVAQDFFTFLLERDVIERARKETAKFRTYLKAVLKNFLIDRHRMDQAIKRGGGKKHLSLDLDEKDERWLAEEAGELQPEEALDRMWARSILDRSILKLKDQLTNEQWELFEFYMGQGGESAPATYKQVAERFEISEWNVWKRMTRILDTLKSLMREEIAQTVSTPDDVDEEFATLSDLLQ